MSPDGVNACFFITVLSIANFWGNQMLGSRFATRTNAFASGAADDWPDRDGKPSRVLMVQRAATVEGLSALDLNYPDQVGADPARH